MSEAEFSLGLVSGNVKKAMSAANAKSRDLWQVDIDSLYVIDGFNVRTEGAALEAHIRWLANSMKADGFKQDKPLAGYVANDGERMVIYVTDGHCRLRAAKLAISEGAQIQTLPVVVAAQSVSEEDLTVSLATANGGKPLTPIEIGAVCKRLQGYGWDEKLIADKLGYTRTYVEGLLSLMGSPKAIRDMVEADQVSAANAIQILRQHGAKAVGVLQEALDRAQRSGSGRVTGKHIASPLHRIVRRSSAALFEAASHVRKDPGFSALSAESRELIEKLLDEVAQKVEKAQKRVAAGENGEAGAQGEEG